MEKIIAENNTHFVIDSFDFQKQMGYKIEGDASCLRVCKKTKKVERQYATRNEMEKDIEYRKMNKRMIKVIRLGTNFESRKNIYCIDKGDYHFQFTNKKYAMKRQRFFDKQGWKNSGVYKV